MRKLIVVWLFCFMGMAQAATLPNPVINNKEWRQPIDFVGYSWADFNSICDNPGGKCNGTLSGGPDLTGWTWASRDTVLSLFEATTGYRMRHTNFEDNQWANNFFDVAGFERTDTFGDNNIKQTRGYTSGATGSGANVLVFNIEGQELGYVGDGLIPPGGLDLPEFETGAWLYKPVPLPAAAWLLGSALLGLGWLKRLRGQFRH